MTQSKKEMTETSPTRKKQPTAAERKLYMQSLERQQKRFAETQNAFKQVRDVTKTTRQIPISSYNKGNVIKYLQNIVMKMNCVVYLVTYFIVVRYILD